MSAQRPSRRGGSRTWRGRPERHFRSALVSSILLHLVMLGGLAHLAERETPPGPWEVFAASDPTPPPPPAAPLALSPRPVRSTPASRTAGRRPAPRPVSPRLVSWRPDPPASPKTPPAPPIVPEVPSGQIGPATAGSPRTAIPDPNPSPAVESQALPRPDAAAVLVTPPAPAEVVHLRPAVPLDGAPGEVEAATAALEPITGGLAIRPTADAPAPVEEGAVETPASRPAVAPLTPIAAATDHSQAPAAPRAAVTPVAEPAARPVPRTRGIEAPTRRTATRTAATASASTQTAGVPSTSGSVVGLGLGRLRIRVDGPSTRTTDRPTEVISGALVGGAPRRVTLQIDERSIEPMRAGRAFTAAVELTPGVNRVRIVATDEHGVETEEVVTIEYRPRTAADIVLSSPHDGLTLTAADPPLVFVQGQVGGGARSTVWIVANSERVAVPVVDGRFRGVLPALAPTMRVRVETDESGEGSETVTVHAGAAVPAIGLLLADWPRDIAVAAQVTATWRPDPSALDPRGQPVPVSGAILDADSAARGFFYLRHARPGVYTFTVRSPAGAPVTVRPTLYVGGRTPLRRLPPVTVDTSGSIVVARLLFPHGVLWEQDEWFSGRSVNGDTVTKFRFPDGVSWMERLGEPRR